MEAADRDYLNNRLFGRVMSLDLIKESSVVMAYASYKSEVDTIGIIKGLLEDKKKIALPKVVGDDMIFYLIEDMSDIVPGYKGIPEPVDTCEVYEPVGKEVMLVPGVAFDRLLFRIGYGKGFYDRYLSKYRKIISIGLAYDFQIVDSIPVESHDRGLSMVLTEKQVIKY